MPISSFVALLMIIALVFIGLLIIGPVIIEAVFSFSKLSEWRDRQIEYLEQQDDE